jgi:DNA-binding transcriptional ArsR family regulator
MSPRRSAAASLAEAAPLFAALGDETRLRIVARLEEVRRYLDEISAQWDSALERLRAFVEK